MVNLTHKIQSQKLVASHYGSFQSLLLKTRHCLIILWQFTYLTPVSKRFGHLVMAMNKVLVAFNLTLVKKFDMLINSARYTCMLYILCTLDNHFNKSACTVLSAVR